MYFYFATCGGNSFLTKAYKSLFDRSRPTKSYGWIIVTLREYTDYRQEKSWLNFRRLWCKTRKQTEAGAVYVGARGRGNCPNPRPCPSPIFKHMGAKRSVLWPSKYAKMRSGSARTPLRELTTHESRRSPYLLVGWGWDTPSHIPPHSRLRRLISPALGARLRRSPLRHSAFSAPRFGRRHCPQIFSSRTAPEKNYKLDQSSM